MLSTYEEITNAVFLHCELAGELLAAHWVERAFQELVEDRDWSWRMKRGQFVLPNVYATGTAAIEQFSDVLTVTGGVLTASMVGRQFRSGNSGLYTIIRYIGPTQVQLDRVWANADLTASTYEIYQAYVTPPEDFSRFLSIINPASGDQLGFGIEARQLDQDDPQRSSAGTPYVLASADYTSSYSGEVSAPVRVKGSGASPVAGGAYTGAVDAIFAVEITTGGAEDVAQFKLSKDGTTVMTGVTCSSIEFELQDGVRVSFPTGVYVLGDVFVIAASTKSYPGLPRFEAYPHVKTATVLHFLYVSRPVGLADGFVLPRTINGNVLLEGALAKCARWPGQDAERRSPYFQQGLAEAHEGRFRKMLNDLQLRDDEIYPQDLSYYESRPYDSRWRGADWYQKHA